MEDTKIQWATHTFNPWRGCTKVSSGCDFCYAEAGAKRFPDVMGEWGPEGSRVVAAEGQWALPPRWNREAGEAEEAARRAGNREEYQRPRVFCASVADVFEGPETMPPWAEANVVATRGRLFELIRCTPHLDWLLLTKRPAGVMKRVEEVRDRSTRTVARSFAGDWLNGLWPRNVWVGTSIENQAVVEERLLALCAVPIGLRFLSVEPLIGPVDLSFAGTLPHTITGTNYVPVYAAIHWVIVGGESGPHARPFDLEWADAIVGECKRWHVPCFVKQVGAKPVTEGIQLRLKSGKGGELSEWPEPLQVRQFPGHYG